MSSDENTQIKLRLPVYLDHVEIGIHFRFNTKAKPSNAIGSSFDRFFHQTNIVCSPNRISLGGPKHISTSGKRLFAVERDGYYPRFRKADRKKTPTHNQLTDIEKGELDLPGVPPWMAQTAILGRAVSGVIDHAKYNISGGDNPFPLKCHAIEFYKEFLLPPNKAEFVKLLSCAVSRVFGPSENKILNRKHYRIAGEASYWRGTAVIAENERREVEIKAYEKGRYIRLEMKIRPQELVEGCTDASVFIGALSKVGLAAQQFLDQLEDQLAVAPSSLDLGRLRDAIAARLTIKNEDPAMLELLKQFGEWGCYQPSAVANEQSRLTSERLKKLTKGPHAIFLKERRGKLNFDSVSNEKSKGNIFVLIDGWESIPAPIRAPRGRPKKNERRTSECRVTDLKHETLLVSPYDVAFDSLLLGFSDCSRWVPVRQHSC